MKLLNEYNSGYPQSINNSQAQQYSGVFGPFDAETVQSNDRFKLQTSNGLQRLNAFLKYFFKRPTLDPKQEIAQLKVRLNHMNLDFPFDNSTKVDDVNDFIVTTGGSAFGVTPTTDLSKGFDSGADLARYNLQISVNKIDGGFKMDAKITPFDQVTEQIIDKSKREDRLDRFKKFKKVLDSKKKKYDR